ncbi:MAG: crotonase/enoyl-CoA hydratase family protein [Hyphomicrobiales bacterium]
MAVRTEKSGAVWTIIHSRPKARNAMNPESADALQAAFLEFDADDSAHVAVLYGEGGAFCAGWDLKFAASLKDTGEISDLDFPHAPKEPGNGGGLPRGPMGPSRLALSKPVIGAIAGPAVAGGMELALWCDCRVMEETAYLGVYCRRWGIPLLDGGTVRLPRIVSLGRALEITMTGRKVPAQECLALGLCEKVVPPGNAREEAEALAHEIARFPQECVRADRASIYAQYGKEYWQAMEAEWRRGIDIVNKEGIAGAGRFAAGAGRSGNFSNI